MACRIIRDTDKEVVSVLAPNGEPSQLFADIMVDVQDTEEALNIYKEVSTLYTPPLDINGEVGWRSVRPDYLDRTIKSSIVDTELLQDLLDNGYLNCE